MPLPAHRAAPRRSRRILQGNSFTVAGAMAYFPPGDSCIFEVTQTSFRETIHPVITGVTRNSLPWNQRCVRQGSVFSRPQDRLKPRGFPFKEIYHPWV